VLDEMALLLIFCLSYIKMMSKCMECWKQFHENFKQHSISMSQDKQIWIHDKGEVNYSNHYTPKFEPDLNFPDQGDIGDGLVYQKEAVRMGVKKAGPGSLLDLGGGLKFEIPLYYDELAASLHLPSFASLQIEERIVYGRLKSMAFFSAMDSDPWSQSWRLQSETGESWRKAPLDNANQRALPPTMQKRFGLQVNHRMITKFLALFALSASLRSVQLR
jgi:hypothetical protein